MASLLSYVPVSYNPETIKNSPLDKIKDPASFISDAAASVITPDFTNVIEDITEGFPTSDISDTNFKVRLVSILELNKGTTRNINQVTFEVTPTLTESRTVEYSPIQPIHMPGGIQVYKFTGSRTFELSAHFISRNTADALTNMRYVQRLRSWTMPYFGMSETSLPQTNNVNDAHQRSVDQIRNRNDTSTVNLLGAPPEVLYLYGYSPAQRTKSEDVAAYNINRIPVVITNLSIQYPEDIDYIPTAISPNAQTEPFPVKMDVSISLTETHSPVEYEKFNLKSFKAGTLKNF